jgi:deoxyribodipyrimidine photolyase-related protein
MKFHPDEVYRWFMEFSIDSYDWVMISNVYSMILHADGGLTTTKPYISGDNYIKKMSGYKGDGKWDVRWKII